MSWISPQKQKKLFFYFQMLNWNNRRSLKRTVWTSSFNRQVENEKKSFRKISHEMYGGGAIRGAPQRAHPPRALLGAPAALPALEQVWICPCYAYIYQCENIGFNRKNQGSMSQIIRSKSDQTQLCGWVVQALGSIASEKIITKLCGFARCR